MSVICHKCNKDTGLNLGAKIPRRELCDCCSADIRCCKMCKYYDRSAYNECAEPSAERIVEKESGNFCDFFELAGASGGAGKEKNDLLAAADALFKK